MTEETYKRAVEIHNRIAEIKSDLWLYCDPYWRICDLDGRELKGKEREEAILKAQKEANKEINQLKQEFERL